jgi:hypothetical protein
MIISFTDILSYVGVGSRRIVVQSQSLAKNWDPIWKINKKPKGLGAWLKWYSACLARAWVWIQTPKYQNTKKKKKRQCHIQGHLDFLLSRLTINLHDQDIAILTNKLLESNREPPIFPLVKWFLTMEQREYNEERKIFLTNFARYLHAKIWI